MKDTARVKRNLVYDSGCDIHVLVMPQQVGYLFREVASDGDGYAPVAFFHRGDIFEVCPIILIEYLGYARSRDRESDIRTPVWYELSLPIIESSGRTDRAPLIRIRERCRFP